MDVADIAASDELTVLRWRAEGVGRRLMQACAIGALAVAIHATPTLLAWLTATVITALIDAALARRMMARPNRRALRAIVGLSSSLSSLTFSSIALVLAAAGGEIAMLAAFLVACGAALNNAVMTRGSRRWAWVMVSPAAAVLLALPWVVMLVSSGVAIGGTLLLSAGVAAYVAFIVRLVEIMRREARALRRTLAAAQSASSAKSDFLATMSHEIRTPLNGVLGMSQAILRDDLSSRQRERMQVLSASGQTLLAILNDILDLSKIEAGRLDLEVSPFDIETLAAGAHAAFTVEANAKGLSFNLVVEPAARGVYLGDSVRVRQILYNLVSNALKFTRWGEVQVTLDRQGDDLTFVVRDTGVGIAPERLPMLFDKFVQADTSTTRQFGGTGLGLAICSQLAEAMGGSIEAWSRPGEGSRFLVRLPLPREHGAALTPLPAAEPREAETPEPPAVRVLAAEDNKVNQLVLRTLLAQLGIEPVIAGDGAEALELWRGGDFELILMDVQMPVMDGPSTVRAIRAEEAATGRRRVPIVALTANAMHHQEKDYRSAGMDDVLSKPIQIDRLFQVVAEAGKASAPDDSSAAAGSTAQRV